MPPMRKPFPASPWTSGPEAAGVRSNAGAIDAFVARAAVGAADRILREEARRVDPEPDQDRRGDVDRRVSADEDADEDGDRQPEDHVRPEQQQRQKREP